MTFIDGAAPPETDLVKDGSDRGFMADVIEASRGAPVIVDFWAPWCGPCKMIAPFLEQLADEYDGRARIVKVDVQDHPNLGRRFNARSIPMLLVFKNGQVHGTQIGAVGKPHLAQLIEKAL